MNERKTEMGDLAWRARAKHLTPASGALAELFGAVFEPLLRKVVREELDARCHPSDDWRDQRQDRVLTPRAHCRAVRRRLAADPNDPWARILGDRFLLTTDAIAEELDRLARPPAGATVRAKPPKPVSPEAEALGLLERKLRQVK